MKIMRYFLALFLLTLVCVAQTKAPAAADTPDDISGTYSFLKDGEFLQIDMEEGNRVTGFVSRYGDSEGDKGAFLDHIIKEGELKGTDLHFKTKVVHGVWYEFTGTVVTDMSKIGQEGFRVLKGKLTQATEGESKGKSREVAFKLMPMDSPTRK
jgi:hypothetical protein